MNRSVGPALVTACLAATGAIILFAFASRAYQGRLARLFETPIPYVILFLCFFVITPAFLLLHRWVGLSLARFAGIALLLGLGSFLWLWFGWNWNQTFLQGRGPLWCFGFPLAGALAYWATLKVMTPELGET